MSDPKCGRCGTSREQMARLKVLEDDVQRLRKTLQGLGTKDGELRAVWDSASEEQQTAVLQAWPELHEAVQRKWQ